MATTDVPVLVDTHAHLDDPQFEHDLEETIRRAVAAGVHFIITVGTNITSSKSAVAIAEAYEGVFAAVGVHPHEAKETDKRTWEELRQLAKHPRVIAIGEIGLDFYRNLSPAPDQRRAFRAQLRMAKELGLPIIVHDRDAHREVLEMLQADGAGLQGVMHCFSGSLETAQEAIQMGFYISTAGSVTFPNAIRLREVIARVPLERLLVETDCPYLAPMPYRGRRNEPVYLRLIATKVAETRGISFQSIAQATTVNARRLFGF